MSRKIKESSYIIATLRIKQNITWSLVILDVRNIGHKNGKNESQALLRGMLFVI